MRAEIISVGSELLLGHTINSDAALVARELARLGIDLLNVQMVGDNATRLEQALALAASRSDIIITTGGLGPTDDDLTKSVIAGFCGLELAKDADSERRLLEYFGSRPISANQIRQAYLPVNCVAFPNDIGTAPGCAVRSASGCHILMLPGPPRELSDMLAKQAVPYLERLSDGVIFSTSLHVFGMGEGAAAEKIADLMVSSNPTVAPYAHGGEMFIKITAKAQSLDRAKAMCEPVAREIESRLGDFVYGRDAGSLESLVVGMLKGAGLSVATAESCTGGLLAKRITDVPGASRVFNLGLVTYSNSAKEKELGVPGGDIEKFGAVSPQVAMSMASNVRSVAGTDFGIGITGIAGPDGGTPEKPVGLTYIALAHRDGCALRRMEPSGVLSERGFVRERASSHALDMLRRSLSGLPIQFDWI